MGAGDHVHHVVAARLVAAVVLVVGARIEVDRAQTLQSSVLVNFKNELVSQMTHRCLSHYKCGHIVRV